MQRQQTANAKLTIDAIVMIAAVASSLALASTISLVIHASSNSVGRYDFAHGMSSIL